MGSFMYCHGKPVIPEDKKEEVIRNMDKIMRIGGMMGFEAAEMFGYKVYLLTPVRYNEKGVADFRMNYLSDEFWEDAGFDKNDCTLGSGKMGWQIFSRVLAAMYYLVEMNSEKDYLVSSNGDYGDRDIFIGWINQICNAKYVDEKSYFPWKVVEMLHGDEDDNYILKIINEITSPKSNILSYFESLYVLDFDKGEQLLKDVENAPAKTDKITIDYIVKLMKERLDSESFSPEECINLMCRSNEEIKEYINTANNGKDSFLVTVMLIGRKIPLKYLAEKYNLDFWYFWEKMKPYEVSLPCWDVVEDGIMLPAKEVPTKDFLGVPDDDRLYYWTPGGDIEISEETLRWLSTLQQELQNISNSIETKESPIEFLRHMMRTLDTMRRSFDELLVFSAMFHEFLDHNDEIIYQASIQLLDRMIQRRIETCNTYKKENEGNVGYSYFFRVKRNEIKRFVAVLSNPELRNRYLWNFCL